MIMTFVIYQILLQRLQRETSGNFEKTHEIAAEVRLIVLTLTILNMFNKLFMVNLK